MSKRFLSITLVALALCFFASSCVKEDGFENRVREIVGTGGEETRIATIEEQVKGMQSTITQLQSAQEKLEEYADKLAEDLTAAKGDIATNATKIAALETELTNVKASITTIEGSIKTLEDGLSELRTYVNDTVAGVKNWVNATFATIETTDGIATRLTAAEKRIQSNADSLKTFTDTVYLHIRKEISDSLASAETRIQGWVNKQLTGYWTIAQTKWKLDSVARAVEVKDSTALSDSLKKASDDLTKAYKAAIKTSIDSLAGAVNDTINKRIERANDILDAKITAIDTRLTALEKTVEKLVARIQKIDVIPDYVGGGVKLNNGWNLVSFAISPDSLAPKLKAGFDAKTTKFTFVMIRALTKAVTYDTLDVTGVALESTGTLELTVRGEKIPSYYYSEEGVSGNGCLKISDDMNCSTSGYFGLYRAKYPGIEDSLCFAVKDIVFAPVNCGYEPRTEEPEYAGFVYGKLYQWGRKYGQGFNDDYYSDPVTPTCKKERVSLADGNKEENKNNFYWDEDVDYWTTETPSATDDWFTTYNPCPEGWRVPTSNELEILLGGILEPTRISGMGIYSDVTGIYLDGTLNAESGVFLPCAGRRMVYAEATCDGRNNVGRYLSSSLKIDGGSPDPFCLVFSTNASMMKEGRAEGCSVRCVQQ